MKNYQILLTAIGSLFVGVSILNGTAQEYVHFAGPMNELGCAVIALTMGVLSAFALDWKGFFNYLTK
jgi:hydrogenase/urease accessory protein HupE